MYIASALKASNSGRGRPLQRYTRNGAIQKPSPSSNHQRIAASGAGKVIDLTRDSDEDGAASEVSQDESDERCEDKSHDVSTDVRPTGSYDTQQAALRPKQNPAPETTELLDDIFVVTFDHHMPWGAGDDHHTVGTFPTEKEAMKAGYADYVTHCLKRADDWEASWSRISGYMCLNGSIEEGEADTETVKITIEKFTQKRKQEVKPVQPTRPPSVKPQYVFLVKEEQRTFSGGDGTSGFYDEVGDLQKVIIHGIYATLEYANESVLLRREDYLGSLDEADLTFDGCGKRLAGFEIEDHGEEMTYSVSVEQRRLQ